MLLLVPPGGVGGGGFPGVELVPCGGGVGEELAGEGGDTGGGEGLEEEPGGNATLLEEVQRGYSEEVPACA